MWISLEEECSPLPLPAPCVERRMWISLEEECSPLPLPAPCVERRVWISLEEAAVRRSRQHLRRTLRDVDVQVSPV